MNHRDLSSALRTTFGESIARLGFQELGRSCIYVRRKRELLDVVVCELSRHGPRFRVSLHSWIPEFIAPGEEGEPLRDQVLRHCSREEFLGAYEVGATKWWPCETREAARLSGEQAGEVFNRSALSWFSGLQTLADLEKRLTPDLPEFVAHRLASGVRTPMPSSVESLPVF